MVSIIMGSDSDLPVMRAAADILKELGVEFELTIVSAHRTPDRMFNFAKQAHERGIKVIIAGAGGAAHLPGMVASLSPLPVIGVPVKSSIREQLSDGSSQAVDRSRFYHVQTPQTFRLDEILAVYQQDIEGHFTDDASLYQAGGGTVVICTGSYDNIKITTPEDMFVGEQLLQKEK